MRPRPLVLCAAAVLLALPMTARASTTCTVLKDRTGDAWLVAPAAGRSVPPLDIRAVDVVTTPATLVVRLRVLTTNAGADPATAFGATWGVAFTVAGVRHVFERRLSATGAQTGSVTVGGTAVPFTMTADGGSVLWTVKRASVPTLKKRGVAMTSFFAQATSVLAHDYAPDDARPSNTRYVDGGRSCAR